MNEKLKRFEDYTEESTLSLLKIILKSLGPLGGAIDEVLFEHGARIRSRRLNRFIEELMFKLKNLEDKMIDNEYLKSDDFYDLTVSVLMSASKTRMVEKHKILSNIFVNSIIKQSAWESDLSQIFIKYLNDLTINHIVIFKYLSENLSSLETLESYEELFTQFLAQSSGMTLDKYEFRMYLRDLENKTFFRFSRDISEYGSSGSYIAFESYKETTGIRITYVGQQFLDFLK